jgi:hypothetical protein
VTAPRFADCRCGHTKLNHDPLAPQCSASGCTCLSYRPSVAEPAAAPTTPPGLRAVPSTRTAAPSAPLIEQLISAGKRSTTQRTVKLAEKIDAELADLRTRVNDEREAVEAKRAADAEREAARVEVARLEEQLAAAKAKLRGRTPPRLHPENPGRPDRHRRLPRTRVRQNRSDQRRRPPLTRARLPGRGVTA